MTHEPLFLKMDLRLCVTDPSISWSPTIFILHTALEAITQVLAPATIIGKKRIPGLSEANVD